MTLKETMATIKMLLDEKAMCQGGLHALQDEVGSTALVVGVVAAAAAVAEVARTPVTIAPLFFTTF